MSRTKLLIVAVALAAASAGFVLEFWHEAVLLGVPARPVAPRAPLRKHVAEALWCGFGEELPVQLDPVGIRGVFAGRSRGARAASFVARAYLERLRQERRLTRRLFLRKLQEGALAVWIRRRWTTDQLLSALSENASYGGIQGLAAAAERYLDKQADGLDVQEAALLSAMAESSRVPEVLALKRNRILCSVVANTNANNVSAVLMADVRYRRADGEVLCRISEPASCNESVPFSVRCRLNGQASVGGQIRPMAREH